MPIHDWSRVDAGTFHDFHTSWIGNLRSILNEGLLPDGFYAMAEQHGGKYIADILTLQATPSSASLPKFRGGVAVADAPPKVRKLVSLSPTARSLRRTVAIRHVSENQLIAIIEIVSPGNKDRLESVHEFIDKIGEILKHGIHVLVIDPFKPGRHDPHGLHGALWERFGDEPDDPPANEPLMFASYVADHPVRAFLEYRGFGQPLPEMPLFLDVGTYVETPLEATYQSTWRGTAKQNRALLESDGI
jgi:hypothetical protein